MCNKRKLYTCVFSCHMWGCARMILYTWCHLKTWLLKFWNRLVLYACTCLLQKTQCGISWHHAIFKTWLPQSWNCLQLVFANHRLWTSKAWTRWLFFKTWHPKFWNVTIFQLMPLGLGNGTNCNIHPDLAFQSGRDGPLCSLRMVHCNTWPQSVEMRFLRKWFGFLRLCIGSCGWNYLTVRNLPHFPSQVLKPFGVKNFNIRPK